MKKKDEKSGTEIMNESKDETLLHKKMVPSMMAKNEYNNTGKIQLAHWNPVEQSCTM